MKRILLLLVFVGLGWSEGWGQVNASFSMDYGMVDKIRAAKLSTTEKLYGLPLNNRYTNLDLITIRDAAILFDSILNPDYDSLEVTYYPRAATQLTLECLDVVIRHSNITHTYDSIDVIVFDSDSFKIDNQGSFPYTATMQNNVLWDTLLVTDSSFVKNVLVQGIPTYTKLTVFPNITFPKTKTFGVRIVFRGDTANKCEMLSFYRDDCNGSCIGEKSAAGLNSYHYLNYVRDTTNYSGFNTLHADCNSSGAVEAGACEEFYVQNWWIVPCVTIQADTSFIQPMPVDTVIPNVLPKAAFTHNCSGGIDFIKIINTSLRDTGQARWVIRLHNEFNPLPDTISYHVGDTILYGPGYYNINGADITSIYVRLMVSNEFGQDSTTALICRIDWEDINETILSDISIFPNPLNDSRFQINGPAEIIGSKCEIMDANGQLIKTIELRTQKSEIKLDVSRGVYFIRIYSEKASLVKRFIRL